MKVEILYINGCPNWREMWQRFPAQDPQPSPWMARTCSLLLDE